ncbi:MAG: Pr6Pr family membrane protein [Microbacteriaceae bacterium]|nr:Pr6Pr family membrane protein [Microbacteriaceae bacterium]
MKYLFAALRTIAGVAIVVAIVGQFMKTASGTAINPFNFFGYFTIQSNIIGAIAFFLSAYFIFRKKSQPIWSSYLRALATVVLAIVGIVYNTLLVDTALENSFNLQWSNDILHFWIPIYAVIDWVFFADRKILPFPNLWYMLVYPIVWLGVILVRGATDGWVPYPFLNPETGYLKVAVYCIIIAAVTILFGYIVYALSRVQILKDDETPTKVSA